MSKVVASIKALIKKDDKYLFVFSPQHKDVWDLPGGKIEYGEEPSIALKREVTEEVGLSIEIGKPVGIWWFYSKNHQDQVICPTFLCTIVGNASVNLELSKEVGEQVIQYKWLTLIEAVSSLTLSESLVILLQEIEQVPT